MCVCWVSLFLFARDCNIWEEKNQSSGHYVHTPSRMEKIFFWNSRKIFCKTWLLFLITTAVKQSKANKIYGWSNLLILDTSSVSHPAFLRSHKERERGNWDFSEYHFGKFQYLELDLMSSQSISSYSLHLQICFLFLNCIWFYHIFFPESCYSLFCDFKILFPLMKWRISILWFQWGLISLHLLKGLVHLTAFHVIPNHLIVFIPFQNFLFLIAYYFIVSPFQSICCTFSWKQIKPCDFNEYEFDKVWSISLHFMSFLSIALFSLCFKKILMVFHFFDFFCLLTSPGFLISRFHCV